MKITIKAILLLTLMIGFANWPSQALAEPVQQESNLLKNPSFEQPFVDGKADGWSGWHIVTEKQDDECLSGYHYQPKWNLETNGTNIADGLTAQYIGNNWDTWAGGVFQTVSVTPGQTYRFTFSGKGRISNDSSPEPSEFGINMNMRAGIDPNGSGAWSDGDVVWSAAQSPHDNWGQFSVETTATGDKITVFTSANLGIPGVNQCRQFIDTWYDNAQLVLVGAAPADTPPPAPAATAPPQATQPPLPSPTVELSPTEVLAITPVPTIEPTAPPASENADSGTICVNAFHDENGNGQRESSEGYMAGVTFTVATQTEIVGQTVSEGMPDPKCFQGLAPGPYQVGQQVPDRLEMTTAGNAAIAVAAGKTIGLEFGSRLRQEEQGSAPPSGGEGSDNGDPDASGQTGGTENGSDSGLDLLSLSGLGVILLGVVLLGVLLFLILRR